MSSQRLCVKHRVRRAIHDLRACGPRPCKYICTPGSSCVAETIIFKKPAAHVGNAMLMQSDTSAALSAPQKTEMSMPSSFLPTKRWKRGVLQPNLKVFVSGANRLYRCPGQLGAQVCFHHSKADILLLQSSLVFEVTAKKCKHQRYSECIDLFLFACYSMQMT